MKATSIITTLRARVAMTLLLATITFTSAWATEFITDVMLIGGTKSEVNNLKAAYQSKGWTVVDKDLNDGCGSSSDYIYLLYKTADNFENSANLTFITGFYLTNETGQLSEHRNFNGLPYHLVPYDGGSHFKSVQGNLNSNCILTSSDIHLYYTTAGLDSKEAIYDIYFNTDKYGNNVVGKNGDKSEGYDLNAGCGKLSDYIFMHYSSSKSNYWNIVTSSDFSQCRITGIESHGQSYYKSVPAIINGAMVTDIYGVNLSTITNLETIYFTDAFEATEMLSVKNCVKLTNIDVVDNNGTVIRKDGLPNRITSIPDSAFKNTNVKNLTMPNVSSIGASAFYDCDSLISVSFGNNIASIGDFAFKGCTQLTKVNISDLAVWCNISFGNSESNPMYCSHNLYLNNEKITDLTIPNNVTSISSNAFCYGYDLTSVTIPNSVTNIGSQAFFHCTGLTSVTIPNSVEDIGSFAFFGCTNLPSVTIPNSVTNIGYKAFYECTALKSVTINSNAIVSKNYTYSSSIKHIFGLQVKKYAIGNDVTSIGEYAFYYCDSFTSVTIGNNVTSIGLCAFQKCSSLASVTIPNSVTSIGEYAFSSCSSLQSVNIPNSVTSIGKAAFYYCESLQSVNISNSVTSIGENVFSGCWALASVTIPNSVTSIGNGAFSNCSALTSVTIPNSVTSIGNDAFYKCYSLADIYFDGTETQWNNVAKEKNWRKDVASSCKEHWRCTVTFDANGHGTAPAAQANLWSNESKATEPDAPTSSGFVLTGWYTDAGCSTRWNFGSDVVPGDMTLYAGWAEVLGSNYTLEVPEQVTIVPNTEWTTVTVDVTALQMQLMADGRTPQFLRLTFNYGTLKNKVDNSKTIPFKLATMNSSTEMDQSNQNVYEAGQKQFRIHISSANWSAATPGTYSGTVSYSVRWRFDNNTWSGDLETGTIPVTVTIPEPLYDGSDNTASITAWAADGQPHNIVLQGRTLYKDGSWNTLCLPFAVTDGDATDDISFSGTPLEGAVVKILDSSSSAKNTLTLNFSSATSITAGTPCIVRWEKTDNNAGNNDHNLYEPTFNGVIINNELHPVDQTAVDFTGSFSPVSLAAGDRSVLYLDANNSLFYPNTAMTIGSCRACFQLADGLFNFDLGDVNGDGIITVTDVMMLVNSILGHVDNNFITANADVNNDNNITVTDVMVLVNNILNGESTFKVVTNIDDFPIKFGGGGKNPARVGKNQIWR